MYLWATGYHSGLQLFNHRQKSYMKNSHKAFLLFILISIVSFGPTSSLKGQVNIFTESFDEINGATSGTSAEGVNWSSTCIGCSGIFAVNNGVFENNNTDNVGEWSTSPIDISSCVRLEITFDYAGDSFAGSGADNLESNTECSACPGDVNNPSSPDCQFCWDFMDFNIEIDGIFEPIGIIGTVNTPTSTTLMYENEDCSGLGDNAVLHVASQTWAADENMTFDNVSMICYDSGPITGVLMGGGILCGTNCTTVTWEISGGEAPYDVGMNFTLGAIDFDFNIPSPTSMGEFQVCLDPNVPIPFFNPPSTVVVNELFGSLATFEMTSVTDNTNCTANLSNQIIDIEIVDEPVATMIDPIDSICIEVGGTATVDLSIYESQIDLTGLYDVIWYSDPGLNNEIGPIFMTSTNTTIYAVVERSEGCISDDIQIQIILSLTPELDPIPPQDACGEYVIPAITGTNTTTNIGVYSASGGMGTQFFEGDIITSNMVLYAYDQNDGCEDEVMFTVTIFPQPDLDPLTPQIVCGYYVLPELTGTNLSGLETYYELPGGMGSTYAEGDTIFQSIVLYAYDILGVCSDDEFLTILISQEPEIDMPPLIAACGQVILPTIEGDNISSDAAYFTGPNGTGTQFNPGDILTTDETLFIYDAIGNCADEASIDILINAGPILDPQGDITVCDYFVLSDIEGTDLTDPFYIDSSTISIYESGDTIFNSAIIYQYDSVPGNGNCFATTSMEITIEEALFAGEDINSNSCAGSQVALFDLLDNATPTNGVFTDLDGSGALINDTLDLNLSGNTEFNIQYIIENTCGPDTVLLSVNVVDITDAGDNQMNSVCEGTLITFSDYIEGDPGGEFYIDGESTSVESVIGAMAGEDLEFIYIVGDGNNCPQDTAVYVFQVIDQPEFFAPTTVEICDFYRLPLVDGEGISGDEAYTTLPFNNGISYLEGDTIWSDVLLYLSFDDGNCQAIDSVFIDIKESTTEFIDEMLCPGDSILVNGTYYHIDQQAGVQNLDNLAGCDSTIIINLSFFSIDTNFIEETLCFGESIMVNGEVYDESNESGMEILENMALSGCDSIIIIDLNFSDAAVTPIDEMICSGDSILINNIYYSEENPNGMDTIQLQNGCDSILDISVQFLQQSTKNIDTILCENEIIIVNGTPYDINLPSGIEIIDNANINGCDSVVNVNLEFHTIDDGMVSGILCADESIDTLGVTIDINNPEEEVVLLGASAQNCDSTIFISYDFITVQEGLQEENICEGGSIQIEGEIYDEQNPTGTYMTQTQDGCDSIVNVLVTFSPVEAEIEIMDANCGEDAEGYIVYTGLNITADMSFYDLDNSGNDIAINVGDTIFGIAPGIHDVNFSTDLGCSSSVDFEIMEADIPQINIPDVATINEGNDYTLTNPIDDTNTILWTPDTDISCTDCGDPSFSPSSTTTYFVEITSPEGCIVLDTILIRVEESFNIFFPNVFTPNDDGINDFFNIFSEQTGAFDIYIHDRWGNKVFEAQGITSNNQSDGWDGQFNGKQVQQGVYAYYGIYYKVISPTEVEAVPFVGDITLTR